MQGVRFSAYQKRKALQYWLEEKKPILKVCQKFKCSEPSLWRWKRVYNGTIESLKPKSSRPHTPHPLSHTQEEREAIIAVFESNPDMSYNEALGILRAKYAYSRSYGGFYNYVVKSGIRPKEQLDRYVPQRYDTPEMLGTKWQMDVKYVPIQCNKMPKKEGDDPWVYQYTMIDEATRERFLYPYIEHNVSSTLDFIKRAILYYGYLPTIMQTDNGLEFTNHKEKKWKDGRTITTKKVHAVDELLSKLKIKHQLIKPYTPRLNGKVERSHRSDQEGFYKYLKFKTFDELKTKMMDWMIRYNNRPHSSLRNREGKKVWWSPMQKRADLLLLLKEKKEEYDEVRFIKNKKTEKQIYTAA